MNTSKIRIVILAIASISILGGAAPPPFIDAPNVTNERRGTATVVLGQRLSLKLPNRVQSGRAWRLASDPAPNLRFVSTGTTQPEINLPDVPFNQLFEFATLKAGVVDVKFEFVPPSPANAPPARTLIMRVTVTGSN